MRSTPDNRKAATSAACSPAESSSCGRYRRTQIQQSNGSSTSASTTRPIRSSSCDACSRSRSRPDAEFLNRRLEDQNAFSKSILLIFCPLVEHSGPLFASAEREPSGHGCEFFSSRHFLFPE